MNISEFDECKETNTSNTWKAEYWIILFNLLADYIAENQGSFDCDNLNGVLDELVILECMDAFGTEGLKIKDVEK